MSELSAYAGNELIEKQRRVLHLKWKHSLSWQVQLLHSRGRSRRWTSPWAERRVTRLLNLEVAGEKAQRQPCKVEQVAAPGY